MLKELDWEQLGKLWCYKKIKKEISRATKISFKSFKEKRNRRQRMFRLEA